MKATPTRRIVLAALAALAAAAALPTFAQAGDYPARAVTLIVSFPPGGSSDFFTRLTAQELSQAWGKPVVVENKPGAGGNIGAAAAARAPADGYTLFMSSIATHGINASLYPTLPYDPVKDFTSVTKIATVPNVLVVHPSVPAKTVKEYIAWVNTDSKNAFYASSGVGTSPHLSTELLKAMTGLQLAHVPYKGSAPALADVVGGQVPMAIDNLPAALALIKAGRLKALAVTSPRRSADLPEVPTMIESGVAGYDVTSWWGLFAPAGTPEAVVRKINADLVKALNSPGMRAAIEKQGATAAPSTPAELAALVTSETARWGQVIRDRGIKAN